MFISVVLGLGIVVGLGGWGLMILRSIRSDMATAQMISIAYPLGAGLFTFLLFLLSWIGIPLSLTMVVISYLLCVILVVLYGRRTRTNLDAEERSSQKPTTLQSAGWGERIAYLSIFGLVLLAAYLSLQRGYSTWDAIGIWGVKGIGIAHEETVLAGSRWGSHGLTYPLNIPLQIAIFRIVGEQLLVGSKLIFPIFYLSLLLGSYTFLKRQSGTVISLLGVLLLGTTPILFEHGTIGYANLPFVTYLVLGLMSLLQGWREGELHARIVGGIMLSLASWTRPEGAFLLGPILIVLYLGMRRMKPQEPLSQGFWWLPLLLLIVIWQVFMASTGSGGIFGETLRIAWTSISSGDMNFSAIYWTARFAIRQVIDPGVWGVLAPAGILLVFLRRREIFTQGPETIIFLFLPALMAGFSVTAYYYLASFQQDIQYLLGTSVNRLFMPVWVLGFLGVFRSNRSARVVIGATSSDEIQAPVDKME